MVTSRDLREIASSVTGEGFKLLRAGGLGRLEKVIRLTRTLTPGTDNVYPPWQGMQYMRDMFDGRAKLEPLDNARYPDLQWTTVRDVLEEHRKTEADRRRAS